MPLDRASLVVEPGGLRGVEHGVPARLRVELVGAGVQRLGLPAALLGPLQLLLGLGLLPPGARGPLLGRGGGALRLQVGGPGLLALLQRGGAVLLALLLALPGPAAPGDDERGHDHEREQHQDDDQRGLHATGVPAGERARTPGQDGPVKLPGDAVALAGYALAAPFCLYPPLFKSMWNGRRHGLFAVQEAGVAMIVTGWALRGDKGGVVVNSAYGVGLAAAYLFAGRRAAS